MNISKIPGCKRKRTKQEIREAKRKLIAEHYRKYDLDVTEEEIIAKVDNRFRDLSARSNKTDWSVPIEEPMKIWEGFVAERKITRRYVDDIYEIASRRRNEQKVCRPRGTTSKGGDFG